MRALVFYEQLFTLRKRVQDLFDTYQGVLYNFLAFIVSITQIFPYAGHINARIIGLFVYTIWRGTPARHNMPTKRKQHTPGNPLRTQRRHPSHSTAAHFNADANSGKTWQDGRFTPEVMLTRRNLLIGAGALGGVALIGGVGTMAIDALEGTQNSIETLEVPESAVTSIDALTLVDWASNMNLVGNFELPYGTQVWATNNTVAACMSPSAAASPLNTVSLLYLENGNNPTVLEAAQGAAERFEIFDVRASESGLVWVECNVLESRWRVYTAQIQRGQLTNILLVDQADGAWLTPSIAAVGDSAFWQVVPNSTGEAANEPSVLKAARFGSEGVEVPYTSRRAFATRITPVSDGVVITPRAQASGTYYQLTKISAADYTMLDQLTLPSSMTPYEATHGSSGFSFAFEGIYNYGGGIANLGTYTPRTAPDPYSYQGVSWLHYGRTPSSAPAWCGNWFVVKSTRSLCGIDLTSLNYFSIDTPSNTDDFGEYLASSGTMDYIVGVSNIQDVEDSANNHTLVRVFTPLA